MDTLGKSDVEFPFTRSPNYESTNSMYMIDPGKHRNRSESNMEIFEAGFKKLQSGEATTHRSEVLDFQSAANKIQASIFTTINEHEVCDTTEKAVLNGITILRSNERFKNIDFSILTTSEHDLSFMTLKDFGEKVHQARMSLQLFSMDSGIRNDIYHIFSRLLPKIAKNTGRLKSDFIKMGLVQKSRTHKTWNIDRALVKQVIMQKIQFLEQEYEKRYKRSLLLSNQYNGGKTERLGQYLQGKSYQINNKGSNNKDYYISPYGHPAYVDSLCNVRGNGFHEHVELSETNQESFHFVTGNGIITALDKDADIYYEENCTAN